jgi:ribosome-associated protein
MVEGYFHIMQSGLLTEAQKELIQTKLSGRINAEGFLQVRSQLHRSQWSNKLDVIDKMNALVAGALKKQKKRIATKPSAASKEKRIESKKKNAQLKESRQKFRYDG